MKKIKLLTLLILTSFISYFFVGVEIIGKEHTNDYDFFIKKHPTTQFTFRNFVLCGECDFRSYDSFTTEGPKKKFRDLCYYKYGLEDIQKCEDLFNPDKIRNKSQH